MYIMLIYRASSRDLRSYKMIILQSPHPKKCNCIRNLKYRDLTEVNKNDIRFTIPLDHGCDRIFGVRMFDCLCECVSSVFPVGIKLAHTCELNPYYNH